MSGAALPSSLCGTPHLCPLDSCIWLLRHSCMLHSKVARLPQFAAILLAINGIARLVAGMFPCEIRCALPRLLLSQKLHSLAAGVGFFALIGASVLWGTLFKRYQSLRGLSAYSIGSGCLGLVFLALIVECRTEDRYRSLRALIQRCIVFVGVSVRSSVMVAKGIQRNGCWPANSTLSGVGSVRSLCLRSPAVVGHTRDL